MYRRALARSTALTDPGRREAARGAALDRLPEPFAVALRMREAGLTSQLIALELAVEPEAVDQLLALAEAKLDRLLRRGEKGRDTGSND